MARIIHDLLDFTRIRNDGRIPVHPGPADLVALVRRAVAELASVHPDREIRLDAPDAAAISGDSDRLGQVVTNLVGNALQHSPADARVTVRVEVEDGGVALAVHNGGPAICDELLPTMFEPFRRGRHGTDGGSLGLGLFIVREVVRAHGGEVAVASSARDGTTFTVRLPSGAAANTGRPAADR
jgi:signal transduction histidine kinase